MVTNIEHWLLSCIAEFLIDDSSDNTNNYIGKKRERK